jgi:hypothetical protein
MANYQMLLVQANGREKRTNTNTLTMDFTAINASTHLQVGAGADFVQITQGGTGANAYLTVGSKAIRSSFVPVNNADLVNKLALDTETAAIYDVIDNIPGAAYVTASDGVKRVGDNMQRDDAKPYVNDNAGTVTVRQVAYIKSNGNVDLAIATNALLTDAQLVVCEDTTVASAASGKFKMRAGAIIPGFTGLTPGAEYFIDNTTAGAINTYAGITWATGNQVVRVGKASSATELIFDPEYQFEF